ncbi:MAG TPA: pseudouridylate synthase [Prevotella sp.]|nr:pseudouridylate synthase [uncultured Prevotella sp.]HBF06553.1 pseudouridylate synthase [Candidatus Segatella violae]
MIEFSNLIGVSLTENASASYQFVADEFTFEPSPTEENGGVYWDCSKTFIIEMPDDEALSRFKITRSAIVSLSEAYSRGNGGTPKVYKIGSLLIPARVQICRHLNKAKLIISCKTLLNPLT